VREILIRGGVVVAVGDGAGAVPLAEGELALVGREAGAATLAAFEPGERVEVVYGPRTDAGEVAVAVGGGTVLLRDGQVPPLDDTALHPRTAIGFSKDGRRMVLVTIDGRQRDSRGMTEKELGELLADLGADDGLNLDGGGSSTMLARDPGESPTVVNSPSDGGERLTPNGLGVAAATGSGQLTGFHVEGAVTADANVDQAERVFTGLSRTVVARGHDETYAPVAATPRWQATPAGVVRVAAGDDGTAVVTGRHPGDVTVVAADGGASGGMDLVVLGEPVRIGTSTTQVSLAGADAAGSFQVLGYERDGFSTWVEPTDVRLSYDEALFDVVAEGDHFRIQPRTGEGAGVVTVQVAGLTTSLAVTVGLRSVTVDTMDDASRWKATRYPSVVTAQASAAPGRDGGAAVALDYSLTGTTATRAAYLAASPQLDLPGAPQRIGAWVHGDGKGAWLRANIYDAAGGSAKTVNLAPRVDWTGWRYVEAEIPAGLTMPLRFFRLYVVETTPSRQYSGRIVVDDLTVKVAQEVKLPPSPVVVDPAVVTDGTVTGADRWRFAVLSDVQFTADDPESDLVAQARRTLRDAMAAGPEFLVINGDFVDRGFARDIALAKRVIDEEVGGRLPLHYVPGNHEAAGPGDLSEWEKVFGPAYRTFDHKGTRFVLLDSSLGSLRAGGFDQLLMLRRALDGAATDNGIRNVVAMAHHPVNDPSPTQNSQLADRKEAQLVVDWLAGLRSRTGKGAAYIASHAGVFAASRQDGVLLPLIGNAGKGPSAAPDAGGFTGWSLVGVQTRPTPADPAVRHRAAPEGRDESGAWLQLELRPHVDALELLAPGSVKAGSVAQVNA
ncbi:MAG: phosphodiester glycosidase family protein, partial [Actinomycetota bacterium]|nr:phosphodiester glycosidase family protein [Actinomycetota bacterium]